MKRENNKSRCVVLGQGNFLRLVEEDGWEYAQRVGSQGIVIILAVTDNEEVIFVEQYRAPVGKKTIELPAGLISDKAKFKNESLISAAKRELLEETGYRTSRIKKILRGPASCGFSSEMLTLVRAYDLEKMGPGGGDELESLIVHEVPLNMTPRWLNHMARKGYLIEPKIFMGLYFLTSV